MDIKFIFGQENGKLIVPKETYDKFVELKEKYKDTDFEEKPIISRIHSKFTGRYFAPTFVKSYEQCPAHCMLNYLELREDSPVLNLGSSVHKVYERAIKENISDKKKIMKIADEEYKNFNLLEEQKKDYYDYIEAFCKFTMYDESTLFDGSKKMYAEHFITADLNIFGVDLGHCTCLIDRLDIDLEKYEINIIDYKTGRVIRGLDYAADNYRNQMITYSWVVKQNYPGFKVNAYLYIPAENLYLKIDTEDLVYQSKWVEEVHDFYDHREVYQIDGYLEQKENQYCKYCSLYHNCSALVPEYDKEIVRIVDEERITQ